MVECNTRYFRRYGAHGNSTATKITIPSSWSCAASPAPTWGFYESAPGGLTAGKTYTVSIWLRGANGGEQALVALNDLAYTIVTLTNTWQRYIAVFPAISSAVASYGPAIEVRDASLSSTMYLWGAQLEQASSAGPYVVTTSTSATGYGGTATFTTSTTTPLAVGSNSLTAVYGGNSSYASSTSPALTQTVNQGGTSTQISSSLNPSAYGTLVTLSALIQTGDVAPTGSVTFFDGSTNLGTASVTSTSTTNLLPYSQQITVSPWWSYCASSGNYWPNVTPNTSAVTAPDGSSTATQFVMPSTYVCMSGPSWGAIDFVSGGLITGETYTVSVWLRGAVGGEVVNFGLNDNAGTQVTLTTSWQRFSVTIPAISTAIQGGGRGFELIGYTPNSTFYAWGAQTEAASSVGPYVTTYATSGTGYGGAATFDIANLAAGTHSLSAVYGGNTNYASSTSSTLAEKVLATPTVSLVASPSTMSVGSLATFTATINGGANPGGTVTFQIDNDTFGTMTVSSGQAVYNGNNENWPAGSYTISAIYSGDANNIGAAGATTETINPVTQPLIASLTPASGAPNTIVTVSGSNFGDTEGAGSSLLFNNSAVPGTPVEQHCYRLRGPRRGRGGRCERDGYHGRRKSGPGDVYGARSRLRS